MGLDSEDFKLFKDIKKELKQQNFLLERQNDILIELVQQMKYNR